MKDTLLSKIKDRYTDIPLSDVKEGDYYGIGTWVRINNFPYVGISLYYNRTFDGQPIQRYVFRFIFNDFKALNRRGFNSLLKKRLNHEFITSVMGGYIYTKDKHENDNDTLIILEYCVAKMRSIIEFTLPLIPDVNQK